MKQKRNFLNSEIRKINEEIYQFRDKQIENERKQRAMNMLTHLMSQSQNEKQKSKDI